MIGTHRLPLRDKISAMRPTTRRLSLAFFSRLPGRTTRLLSATVLGLALAPGSEPAAETTDELFRQFADRAAIHSGKVIDFGMPATRRLAVVIGNDDYLHAPDLLNARSDARRMTEFLRGQGFRVDERLNLDKRGFEDLLRRMLYEVGPDAEVLFYFAGHGIQIGRRNYLLPVDAELSSAYDVPFETVTLDSLVRILGARSRLQLIILDSCRNNPFAEAKMMTEIDPRLFETDDGFSAISAPVNSLVAYATSPGEIAFDGDDGQSPFTGSLIQIAATEPALSMRELLDRVRREVYTRTDGQQVPWESSTLVEPFALTSTQEASGATPAHGRTRGLATIVAEFAPPTAQQPLTIAAPLDRRIALGSALGEALGQPPAKLTIDAELQSGRLVVEDTRVADYRGQALPGGDLERLVYEYVPRQRRGLGDAEDFTVTESLSVSGPDGINREVKLVLPADPCDAEAGDWLDPEGVGLARYPNEIEPGAAIAACRAAVERSPEMGRFHYQLGRALQADLNYDEARAAFEKARDLGHTRAWHALGDLVAEVASIHGGQGDGAAPAEALEFYAEGVERGDPYAYHALGKQLLRHGQSEAVRRQGFDLLSQAIELGHTFAMNELGYYFLVEGSDDYEPQRGLRYLKESAARNDIYGFNNLGLVYDQGLGGVSPAPAEALEWYERAADGGHPFAPVNIGRMYYNGKLGPPDLVQAIHWYDQGLDRGNAWGGANAAWIIANDRPAGFTPADAAIRAAKAAALRDREAAAQALDVLRALDRRFLDTAAQMMIREHDPAQVVDGLVGPQTLAAIDALAVEHGLPPPPDDPVERLLLLARIHWQTARIRIDLL